MGRGVEESRSRGVEEPRSRGVEKRRRREEAVMLSPQAKHLALRTGGAEFLHFGQDDDLATPPSS
jgi:hypothetical protein